MKLGWFTKYLQRNHTKGITLNKVNSVLLWSLGERVSPTSYFNIKCDALRDSVSFLQFKKHEKHPCRTVPFSKVAGYTHGVVLLLVVKF